MNGKSVYYLKSQKKIIFSDKSNGLSAHPPTVKSQGFNAEECKRLEQIETVFFNFK
jgi:hypothetical protein